MKKNILLVKDLKNWLSQFSDNCIIICPTDHDTLYIYPENWDGKESYELEKSIAELNLPDIYDFICEKN